MRHALVVPFAEVVVLLAEVEPERWERHSRFAFREG